MNRGSDRPDRERAPPPPEGVDVLGIVLEEWPDPKGEPRVLARFDSLSLAEATFDAALSVDPGRRLRLREGTQVVRASRGLAGDLS